MSDTSAATDSLLSLAGSLTEDEADEMKQIIEDHFEKIDPNDWK